MGNQATKSARIRVIVIVVVVFTALAVFLWLRTRRAGLGNDFIDFRDAAKATGSVSETPPSGRSTTPSSSSPAETLAAQASPISPNALNAEATPSSASTPIPVNLTPQGNYVGTLKLIIPVTGVRSDQLRDTFTDSRSEGRVHDAIDIPAASGTPVVAVADGEIIKLFQSERGGTTIYQFSPDKKLVFYYAHLQRYADGLGAGKFVRQGEVIAFVGDTGNAGTGNFHLHFSISVIADPKRYWEGSNINPYPILRK